LIFASQTGKKIKLFAAFRVYRFKCAITLFLYTCILLQSGTIVGSVFAIIFGIKVIVFAREVVKEHEKNAKERAEAFDRIELKMENIEKTQERIKEKCAQIQFNNEDKADSVVDKIMRDKAAKSRD
jgi:uncharacterized membrane protein YhiD involved in acid resistance